MLRVLKDAGKFIGELLIEKCGGDSGAPNWNLKTENHEGQPAITMDNADLRLRSSYRDVEIFSAENHHAKLDNATGRFVVEGLVLENQDGKNYKIEVIAGVLTATEIV